jgi:spore coat protein U-like protein
MTPDKHIIRDASCMHPLLRKAMFTAALATGFLLWSQAAPADPSCSFTSVAGVGFGNYNVFAGAPNDNGIGGLTIRCQGGAGHTFAYDVRLSTGQSHTYVSRVMKSGGNALNYNLYTSSTRTTVWGDGSGTSGTLQAGRNTTTTFSVFGRIPANQDVPIGTYTDSIVATVYF